MKGNHREKVIQIALRDYKSAKSDNICGIDKTRLLDAINMLENVYIMCACFNIKGVDEIQKILRNEGKIN